MLGCAWRCVLACALSVSGCGESGRAVGPGAAGEPDTAPGDAGETRDGGPFGDTPSALCLEHATQEFTVRLLGEGFDAHEGETLFAVTELTLAFSPEVSCRVAARAQVRQGSFELALTNVTDGAIYPSASAFLDVDGNGRCDSGVDPTWHSMPTWAFLTLSLAPSDFSTAPGEGVCD